MTVPLSPYWNLRLYVCHPFPCRIRQRAMCELRITGALVCLIKWEQVQIVLTLSVVSRLAR
jgi:hypothetical protein